MPTYDSISTTTLGSSATTVTLSSLPQTFTDLRLVMRLSGTSLETIRLRMNGNTSSVYNGAYVWASGDTSFTGTSYTSNSSSVIGQIRSEGSGSFNTFILDFFSYRKSNLGRTGLIYATDNVQSGSTSNANRGTFSWSDTNAVTSITIFTAGGGNMASGSTFSLYGILGV